MRSGRRCARTGRVGLASRRHRSLGHARAPGAPRDPCLRRHRGRHCHTRPPERAPSPCVSGRVLRCSACLLRSAPAGLARQRPCVAGRDGRQLRGGPALARGGTLDARTSGAPASHGLCRRASRHAFGLPGIAPCWYQSRDRGPCGRRCLEPHERCHRRHCGRVARVGYGPRVLYAGRPLGRYLPEPGALRARPLGGACCGGLPRSRHRPPGRWGTRPRTALASTYAPADLAPSLARRF